jgi:hypothetical protein
VEQAKKTCDGRSKAIEGTQVKFSVITPGIHAVSCG